MDETGIGRFPGNLDPRAQEFRPRYPNSHNHVTVIPHHPQQFFYPYAAPPYPPPEIPAVPFFDGGVGFPLSVSPPAYVAPVAPAVCTGFVQMSPPSGAPTRALALSSVPYEVTEAAVRRELEAFGEVRGVQMDRLRDGIVTVHFYDLRHAQSAVKEIREQHMQQQSRLRTHYGAVFAAARCDGDNSLGPAPLPPPARGLISGCAVWAQFVVPASHAVPDGHNQGTIVIFNLDPDVTTCFLKETFEAFGPVKELRETPLKKHQRFVEFFDVRDAAAALREMNGKEIKGRSVVIEFSRPGGHNRKFHNSAAASLHPASPNVPVAIQKYPPPAPPSLQFTGRPTSSNPSSPSSHGSQNSQHSGKRSGYQKGFNRNSIESAKCGGEEKESSAAPARRSGKKSQSHHIVTVATKQPKTRPWKGGRHGRKLDTRFLISEDSPAESNVRDSRTTVMIKNIPNKYSQKLLLNMLDNHCIHCNEQIGDNSDQPLSAYDFVYLPIDFNNKCNVGYGFVNMTSPAATLRLYKAFHQQHWEVFNSRKICEVTYARVQGLEALKEHFKNSKFPCEMEHYLPVVFSPPRDGKQLTDPLAVVAPSNCRPEPPFIGGLRISSTADDFTGDLDIVSDDGDVSDQQDGSSELVNGS